MLNDLAEAMKALDGKKYFCGYRHLTALHVNLNSSFALIERV